MRLSPTLILPFIALFHGTAAHARPNVIVVMTDDQGYGDISALGNPVIRTPNLDKLHSESVRLIDFHVDPTCAPTRSALLSGKYSHRAGVWHTICGGNHLRASETTIADVFKAGGYGTAIFGKWHLGSNYPYRPMDRGFDEWLGQGDGGTGTTDDHFWNDRVNDRYLQNGEWKQIDGWAPDVFFDAAINYVKKQKGKEEPFFMYLCTYIPHSPHTLPDRSWVDPYRGKVDDRTAWFFAAIEHVDKNIGRLRQTLEDEGLAENTIFVFLTDNGGTGGVKVFNAGMRGKKGSEYDGGHRVPFFIHWPGGELEHGKDVSDLNAHIDVLPTLAELCEVDLPEKSDLDGRSFAKQLRETSYQLPERTLCVELQRSFKPMKWQRAAAMTSRWRLVNNEELFDIHKDPGQKQNVTDEHPEVVAKLRSDFDRYWERVTPGDRDRVVFIAGTESDPELFLHPADWYLASVPWNHSQVSTGPGLSGNWIVRAEEAGTYRFEVRRWPREAEAPITGVPKTPKAIDAWTAAGAVPGLIYGDRFKALSITKARLKVGEEVLEKEVKDGDAEVVFEMTLRDQPTEVFGEFLGADGNAISGTYYIYCRKAASASR